MELLIHKVLKLAGRAENKVEKTKGRKRYIVVDMRGNFLSVVVHAANIHDTKFSVFTAQKAIQKYLSNVFVLMQVIENSFEKDIENQLNRGVDISSRIKSDWNIIAKLWIVERTFSWFNNSRRLSKDYKVSLLSVQSMCLIAASLNFQILVYWCRFLKNFI